MIKLTKSQRRHLESLKATNGQRRVFYNEIFNLNKRLIAEVAKESFATPMTITKMIIIENKELLGDISRRYLKDNLIAYMDENGIRYNKGAPKPGQFTKKPKPEPISDEMKESDEVNTPLSAKRNEQSKKSFATAPKRKSIKPKAKSKQGDTK